MTPTHVCDMMNDVYEVLKTMSIEEIVRAYDTAIIAMDEKSSALFEHQCKFALMKKITGAWS